MISIPLLTTNTGIPPNPTYTYDSCDKLFVYICTYCMQGGNQPIHVAAMNGCVDIVEYLVKEHNVSLHVATTSVRKCINTHVATHLHAYMYQDGLLPIHFASINGHLDMFRVLTKLGSDPRSATHDPVSNYTNPFCYKLQLRT